MKIVWGRSVGWNIEIHKMEYTIIKNGAGCYPWRKTFLFLPKESIAGKRLFWTKAYKRRVWVVWGTGFHMEPAVQYATLFEVLSLDHDKD
jgi:hypothetical protein